ncbi:MAG: carbon-nitrogen hydrolase family protein [Acidimicrobiales bacterium]|nr:carbon-nitrogen hydrolase family protein [Acidimicrobiales bacterium]
MTTLRVAAVQLTSTPDVERNLASAARLVAEAADRGSRLVVLPEMVHCTGPGEVLRASAQPLDGPFTAWAAALARSHGVWLVAGSFIEAAPDGRRHNTCCTFDPTGAPVAVYRKVHLFDVHVPGAQLQESATVSPGSDLVVFDGPRPDGGPPDGGGSPRPGAIPPVRLGCSICYDLRFPELYRVLALEGADVVVLPAAFTAATGPPHWEILLRARAIENQVFVIAANQVGRSTERLAWHGHSMVVDPWGRVLAEAGGEEGLLVADLDLAEQAHIRATLPSVANRQPAAYRWP